MNEKARTKKNEYRCSLTWLGHFRMYSSTKLSIYLTYLICFALLALLSCLLACLLACLLCFALLCLIWFVSSAQLTTLVVLLCFGCLHALITLLCQLCLASYTPETHPLTYLSWLYLSQLGLSMVCYVWLLVWLQFAWFGCLCFFRSICFTLFAHFALLCLIYFASHAVDFTWRGLASVQKACFRMANWLAGILSVFIKNPLNLSKTGPILARFEVEHDFLKTNIPMINFEVFFFCKTTFLFIFY